MAAGARELKLEAEAGGIARLTVMDHFWHIGPVGAPEQDELLDSLRAGHDLGFTTTYVFARNPEPRMQLRLLTR